MLLELDIKCKPFTATEVVDGITYTLRIARASDKPSTIIKTSDGRYFRDANTHFRWGSGASDNEIIAAQLSYARQKIGCNELFEKVWQNVYGCHLNDLGSPWRDDRYDFLLKESFGYSFAEVENMTKQKFDEFIKTKLK